MAEPSALPKEGTLEAETYRKTKAKKCVDAGVAAGTNSAAWTCIATAIPTLYGARAIPWAKANLNYTAQALIISSATIAAYFITSEKTIMECTKSSSWADVEARRSQSSKQ